MYSIDTGSICLYKTYISDAEDADSYTKIYTFSFLKTNLHM